MTECLFGLQIHTPQSKTFISFNNATRVLNLLTHTHLIITRCTLANTGFKGLYGNKEALSEETSMDTFVFRNDLYLNDKDEHRNR